MAEGPKVVGDLQAAGFRPVAIYDEMEDVRRISQLQHPQGVVGVFEIPTGPRDGAGIDPSELTLVLDGVQDPGNLGTIIRVADWFGVGAIWCSPDTADCWNPKVVQATMGSIARVAIHYAPLVPLIDALDKDCPIYTTQLDGENIYETTLKPHGVIVMGNEGNGVTEATGHTTAAHPQFPPRQDDSRVAQCGDRHGPGLRRVSAQDVLRQECVRTECSRTRLFQDRIV